MTPRPTQPSPGTLLSTLAGDLRAVLQDYTARYTQLRALTDAQREALRRADGPEVERLAGTQAGILQAIAVIDRRRDALVNAAAAALPGLRASPITLSAIAAALPGSPSDDLRARAAALRVLVRETGEASNLVGAAARTLLTHFEGLMRQVSGRLSHAGTYSRRGVVEAGGPVLSALDLRS